jgi:hypothetical protein
MHVYQVRPRKDKRGVDLIFFATLFLCAACECAFGGDAVFSNDGQHIYTAVWEATEGTAQLQHIDLSKRTIKLIPLKEPSGNFRGVSRWNNEDILCATATALWRYHPADGTCTKVCDVPQEPVDVTGKQGLDAAKDRQFTDVAYDPKTRTILLRTQIFHLPEPPINGLWLLKEGDSKLQLVRVSRVGEVECPVFDANGELLFSSLGDLWHGKVVVPRFFGDEAPWLVAYRYAPLATLETNVGQSPAQQGVAEIAVARNFIYLFTKRMWGSGYWRLARLPRVATRHLKKPLGDFDTHIDLPDRWGLYRQVLNSAEILTDETDGPCYLCASADESRVYYTANHKHWLITNGKLQELRFDRAEEASSQNR